MISSNNQSYRLPDFIGIGTRRCGTSWLHSVLNTHPDIGKPPNGVHYFSSHFDKDLAWYGQQIAPYANKKALVEFSVSYSYPEFCEQAALKMYKEVPEAKLFICVRHPVARAYSDYLRSIRMAEIPAKQSFAECIEKNSIYLERSHYARLLKPYLELFPKERLNILFFEDLAANPVAFAADVARYLGVSFEFDSDVVNRVEPKGKTVRSEVLNSTIIAIKGLVDSVFESLGYADLWSDWKGRYVYIYEKALDLTYSKQENDKKLFAQLRRQFYEDVDFLERLTGRDLKKLYGF